MHIGIFAERFIGRYGADRVCVILAELLQQRGHRVTLVGVRFSPPVLERFPRQTVRVPELSPRAPEEQTLRYLQEVRYFHRRHLPEFDACVVGSYPFISAIPYLRTLAPQVVFLDFGVVPTFGYRPQQARLIDEVRLNRQKHLCHTTHIVAISDFIAESQSRRDCDGEVEVSTILLGADHLVSRLGYTEEAPRTEGPNVPERSYTLDVLEQLQARYRKTILALGRWEPGCYKNSQAAFDVMRALVDAEPDAALLVMAHPHGFAAPPGLEDHVFCIGLPSDAELLEVTRRVDAGISVSLWEGFNLPVAELQYLEKQVFCFRVAAHPEVVVSPDQLCLDAEEMAAKLYQALQTDYSARTAQLARAPSWAEPAVLDPWREKFSWRRFGEEFGRVLERAA